MSRNKSIYFIFIPAALAVFLILGALYIFFSVNNYSYYSPPTNRGGEADTYFFKDKPVEADPFITRVPRLEDILAGPIISVRDPSLGNIEAPVTIVYFSDFYCRFCAEQEETLKKVVAKWPEKVRLIWKDYPESSQTSVSYQAAVSARCAQEQEQFWAYHDLLFQSVDELSQNKFLSLADELNLDKDKFSVCLKTNKVDNLINDNIEEANALGINGIPFIYINDREILGEISFTEIEQLIKIELERIEE